MSASILLRQFAFYVHDFMSQKGVTSQIVDAHDNKEKDGEPIWEPKVLAGNGIAGKIKGHQYRVLKVFRGGLPPAMSQPRKAFYSQSHLQGYQPPLLLEYASPSDFVLRPNIIYLWEIVKGKLNLYLAIPRHYTLFASTRLTAIPNPITTIRPELEMPDEDTSEYSQASLMERI